MRNGGVEKFAGGGLRTHYSVTSVSGAALVLLAVLFTVFMGIMVLKSYMKLNESMSVTERALRAGVINKK